ncbi:MAG: ParA family protein [Desulfotignum sp.]|nr:ParA family protein [Desulfotignum sp.]MCF8125903.1 ParA family protein [Desulfotignum sp.]
MATTLTISGQKGGIGKSTIAVNLAATLALYEKKVLLIDCDPRGCATEWIKGSNPGDRHDISSVLNKRVRSADAVVKTQLAWLDILPAGFGLFETGLKLSKTIPGQVVLRTLIEQDLTASYEYIIIDAPSSYGFLSVMALAASDWLIVPICPGMTSKADCLCLFRLINYIRKTHSTSLKIGGFVFNRCNSSDEIQIFLKDQNLTQIADLVCRTCIPEDIRVEKSIIQKTPLVLHDIKTAAGKSFLGLAKEIDLIFK